MVKNSSIPYPVQLPIFATFIFDKPGSAFLSGIAQIVDIFASAYVTSLLFYYMVDFLPAIKREKASKEIIDTKLVSIYLYISQLLAMIDYAAEQEKSLPTDSKSLNDLSFSNKVIYCKQITLKDGVENGTIPYAYNLLKDCDKYRTLILNACISLSGIPSFSFCDTEVIDTISAIQLLDMMQTLPYANDMLLNHNIGFCCMSLDVDYNRLSALKEKLGGFVSTKWSYKMIDITESEIQQWQQKQAKVLSENPELIDILSNLRSE